MTQQTQAVETTKAAAPAKRAAGISEFLLSPKWAEEIQKVLPQGFPLETMIRVARSAANDPKFARANPISFLTSLLKCARAGLYPDGREAHLMCFGTEVTCIFDVKGIATLASRAGIMVTPILVHANDVFQVMGDDGNGKTKVIHEINYMKPRGDLMVVYSRAVMKDGQVDYEIMTADEVDHVRKTYSKQSDKGPWKDSFGEMAKKTAIKRHSKRWDMAPEISQAMNGDDDSIIPTTETKISAPIFKEAAAQIEAPKAQMDNPKGKSQPKPEVVSKPQAKSNPNAQKVRGLCEQDDIGEFTLIKYVEALGMSEPEHKVLEDLEDENLLNIIDRWDDLVQGIKEDEEAQG